MTEPVADYQRGFEAGLLIGLRAADCVIRDGDGRQGIQRLIDEMSALKREREQDALGIRRMVRADIFLEMPLMQAADLYGTAFPTQMESDKG